MNHTDVLERLLDHYASVPAPAPSGDLLARMDAGGVGVAEERGRGAVVVPLTPRPQLRVRYLVAAMVATFLAFSGLAVAGALPHSIQRGVASVVSHVGIDLPKPDAPTPRPARGDGGGTPQGSTPGASTPGHGSGGSSSTGSVHGGSSGSTSPSPTTGGDASSGTSSTPTTGGDPSVLGDPSVPLTVPGLPLPPLTVPGLPLPPLTVPGLPLPPFSLPQLPLDLPAR